MKSLSILAVSCLLFGLAACGSKVPEPDATGSAPAPGATTSAPASDAPTVSPTDPVDPTEPADPTASAIKTPDEDLTAAPLPEEQKSAAPASFGGKITYKDGTTIQVTDVKKRSMTPAATVGSGKGKVGQPFYLITIRIDNPTSKTLVAAGADTMTLPNGNVALSVVDSGTSALGGKIAPGKSRSGSYGYVIPPQYLSKLQLDFYWDNDSDHDAATFQGSLKTT